MKLRNLLVISALSFGLFAAINVLSARPPSPIPGQAAEGKRVWQRNNCVSCHTLFGNGGYAGDDLTKINAKMSTQQVVDYLVNPPVMRPNKYRHHPALNKGDAENLAQYLEYVGTIPTLGWPPQSEKPGYGS